MSLPQSPTFEKTKSSNLGLLPMNTFTAEQQRFQLKNSMTDLINLDSEPNTKLTRCMTTARSARYSTTRAAHVEQTISENNMNVIRETNACVLNRNNLKNERKKILEMDIDTDSRVWNRIKRRQM